MVGMGNNISGILTDNIYMNLKLNTLLIIRFSGFHFNVAT